MKINRFRVNKSPAAAVDTRRRYGKMKVLKAALRQHRLSHSAGQQEVNVLTVRADQDAFYRDGEMVLGSKIGGALKQSKCANYAGLFFEI